jgi:hypothetical protein
VTSLKYVELWCDGQHQATAHLQCLSKELECLGLARDTDSSLALSLTLSAYSAKISEVGDR